MSMVLTSHGLNELSADMDVEALEDFLLDLFQMLSTVNETENIIM